MTPHPDYAAPNVVTLLTAKGHTLTKKITKAGTKLPASKPEEFTHEAEPVNDLEDLSGLLRWLIDKTDTYIVRPAIIEGAPNEIRRRCSGPEQGMVDAPRDWLMVDIDKPVVLFPGNWRSDPQGHLRRLIKVALPEAFHHAGVVAQFSSGMSADGGTPRVHLWFWLSRPLIGRAAKRWLKSCPIDNTIYNRGQPHYTAAPIFEGGVDPLGEQRNVFMPGPVVEVPDDIDTSAQEEIGVDMSIDLSSLRNLDLGRFSWRLRVEEIGDHEGGKGLHGGIRDAAYAFVLCHYDTQAPDPAAGLDYGKFERAVLEHVSTLDLPPDRQADLDERLHDMERSFWGAVPKVEEAIQRGGFPIHIDSIPRVTKRTTLAERCARRRAERDAG